MKISCINIFEYFGCSSNLKSALSDFYVKNHNCVILLATNDNGEQVGLLLYDEKGVVEILYVKANDSSVKKELLNYLIDSSNKAIRYRIVNNQDDEKIAVDCGFTYENSLNIYHSKDTSQPGVIAFLEKYNKLHNSLLKKDYSVKGFEELSEDELNQIKYNPDNEFASELNPAKYLNDSNSNVSVSASTAVIKDGKVVAYSLIRCVANKKCIFELLCVAKSHQKSFVIVPAIMRPLNELMKDGYTYITFAAYQRNTEVIRVYNNHMSEALESVTVQHNMICVKNK